MLFPFSYIQILKNKSALVIIVVICSNWLVRRQRHVHHGVLWMQPVSMVSGPRRDMLPAQSVLLSQNCTVFQPTALNSDIHGKQQHCGRASVYYSPQYFVVHGIPAPHTPQSLIWCLYQPLFQYPSLQYPEPRSRLLARFQFLNQFKLYNLHKTPTAPHNLNSQRTHVATAIDLTDRWYFSLLLVKMANLTLYNIGIIAITCLGGFTYGFGFAVFVSSIGQPGFYTYFKLDRKSICITFSIF